ncbi:MAG: peptidylprolyl isomerase [Oscillospiraceae bacterium]|nr:peptidylprolyl isomerase [Oscillospiraceae bacterium]
MLCGCGQKTVKLAKVDSGEIQFSGPAGGDTVATIKTNMGDIKVVLYPKQAPLAVENFVTHAQNGYYDGVKFHRVIKDFVIQSGDPEGTGNGGNSIWQLPFSDEFSDMLHHYTGALSMANSGEDTNRSQFFIVASQPKGITDEIAELMAGAGWRQEIIDAYRQAGGAPNLDYRHTVFGQVYDGLEIVFDISFVKTDDNDRPKEDVIIETIEISVVE